MKQILLIMNRFLQSFVNLLSLGRAQREEFVYPTQELLFISRSGSEPADNILAQLQSIPLFTQVKPLQRTSYSDVMAMPPETWSSHCLYFNSSAQIQAWLSELPPTKGSQPLYLELYSSWDLIKLRKLPWDIISRGYQPTFVGMELLNERNSLEAYQRWINKGATIAINPSIVQGGSSPKSPQRKLAQSLISYQIDGCYALYDDELEAWLENLTSPKP